MKYGYARVSTTEQDHAGQIDALKTAGAVKVFSEKISGVKADRPQLARAIAALDQGDVLAVMRIDRLARSSRDLLDIVHEVEARGATFESLTEPWANTNSPQAAAMLTMLSAFAQLERSFILARTADGRARSKAQGRHFGPKFKLNQEQIAHARDLQNQEKGLREIGRLLGCHASTVSRALRQQEEEEIA
ncbi:recombinase family protein [Bradyrhizobium canariense]|uniref:Resolvase n=1 Tax=Bradyrhizobium canariense TaxID=255045 RepID=A0A1X3H390_9BRAD|nr:recombinase family protein [Bradyrhizobium canariense]OSI68603.1 resolvase [Bradyrhizobium canariense]OSI78051.1 resolvase [Bradyrhizobium canariense]OSI89281.1 resolvase [Bradyrhizobium canariense]OSI93110.1 resolvase [Bradyrhizobium canariense]OSJ03080.1 resolvase [Bradyrhizobium canariense]